VRKRLLFSLVVLLAVFSAVETWARRGFRVGDEMLAPQNAIYQDDALVFWRLRPHLRAPQMYGTLTTNSMGMRGPEATQSPAPGVHRVIMLGESGTMGVGVDDADTYAAKTQSALDEAQPGKWEVLNAGVGAYTIVQSMLWFEGRGLALQPSTIVVYHELNDYLPTGVIDPANVLYAVADTDRQMYEKRRYLRPLLELALHSRAYMRLRKWILLNKTRLPMIHTVPTVGVRVPRADREWAWNRLVNAAQAAGVRVVVLRPTYQGWQPHDQLVPWVAKTRGLTLVDLAEARRQSGVPERIYFYDGVHPARAGTEVIGRAVAKALLGEG